MSGGRRRIGGATATFDLIGNVDIRDYNQSIFTNAINGTTAVHVFDNGQGQRLDRQAFDLPAAFDGQILTDITITDNGAPGVQRLVLAAATLELTPQATTTPEPATVALLAGGLAALGAVARRRTREA